LQIDHEDFAVKPVAGFARDAFLSSAAAAAGRGISLLGLIAITRIFPADTYGAWLLVLTFSSFFLPLSTLRLEIPLVMTKSHRMAQGLGYAITLCLLIVLVSVLAFAIIASPNIIQRLTGLAETQSDLVYFSIPTVFLLAAQLLSQSLLIRRKHFYTLAVVSVLSPLLSLSLTLLLPFMVPVTPHLAAVIFLVPMGICLLVSYPSLQLGLGLHPHGFSRIAIARAAFRHYSVYPKYTLPLSLSVSVTERVTQLVLAQAYSLGTLASFFMARQILSGFSSVVASSLRNAFFAHSARDNSISMTRNRAMQMLKLLTYLLAPALALGVFRIEEVVSYTAGSKWPNLAPMAWLCMFPATFLVFTGPLDRVFDLVGRQRLSIFLQLTSDIVMLTTITAAVYAGVSSHTLVGIISTVMVGYNFVWLCFTLRSLAMSYTQIAMYFARFAIYFVVCLVLQWPLTFLDSKMLSWIFSLVLFGVQSAPALIVLASSLLVFQRKMSPALTGWIQRLP
jgi:lipopolysaccharide exporter